MTLPEEVEEVLDRLPEDRDLLPEEALPVATALGADGVSRMTYTDDSGALACFCTLLWWSESGTVAWLSRGEVDVLAVGASHAEFLDAVDRVSERFDADSREGEVLRLSDDGEVRERFDRDL